jgi:ankyrin repeat protein
LPFYASCALVSFFITLNKIFLISTTRFSSAYVDEAELFLKGNSNINQCDNMMKTPLILAVEGGHTKVVTMLVENKCDIDISDHCFYYNNEIIKKINVNL